MYIGVTDKDWYEQLKGQKPEEVNFWKPGSSNFKALQLNDMFLFKLHHEVPRATSWRYRHRARKP